MAPLGILTLGRLPMFFLSLTSFIASSNRKSRAAATQDAWLAWLVYACAAVLMVRSEHFLS